jgi:nucleotide-binding universal stress UspA family protein
MSGIVVGVDGSPHSQKALDWAISEAALRNVHLAVVAVAPAAASIWGITGQFSPSQETQDKVNGAAKKVVDQAISSHSYQDVSLRTVSGVPADELVKASQDADLLVVAARGAGGFKRLRMGSVSDQVARHAHCPVVIVTSGEER